MAVWDIIPDMDVKVEDIIDTIEYHGGSVEYGGGYNVAGLFTPSAKINKWARFKPESFKKNFGLTDEERRSNHYGLNMTSYQYLFGSANKILVTDGNIDISEDKDGFLYKLCKGTLGQFDYILPQGGENSPYRLGDFLGYNPSAANPLPKVVDGIYKYSTAGAVDVDMNLETPSINGLTMEDLAVNANLPLESMYYGMVIYNDDLTMVIFGTQTAEQKRKGRNVLTLTNTQYADITSKRGQFKAKAFLSDIPVGINDYTAQPSILLADDDEYASVKLLPNYEAEVGLSKEYKTISADKYRLVVNITNNSANYITVVSCRFLESGSVAEEEANNTPLTIEPFGSGFVYRETGILSGDSFFATLVIGDKTYTV